MDPRINCCFIGFMVKKMCKLTFMRTRIVFLFLALISLVVAEELPYIAPVTPKPVAYQAAITPGGAVKVTLGNQAYVVQGDFSLIPGWAKFLEAGNEGFTSLSVNGDKATAEATGFRLDRKLTREAECLIVTDIITNTSSENLPLMYRQYITLPKIKEYRLCGNRYYTKRGTATNSINATVMVVPEQGGSIALLALSDIFRVHVKSFCAKGMYGLSDDNLVLKPGASAEMSFAIFPSASSDYYDVVNAMRRYLKVNYTLEKGFAFLAPYPKGVPTKTKGIFRKGAYNTVEELREWLDFKSADYVSCGAVKQKPMSEFGHSSAWMNTHKIKEHQDFHRKIMEARPTARVFHYFHSYIDVKSKMDQGVYEDSKHLMPNGSQADYRNPDLPLYIMVEGTNWAKMQERRLKELLGPFGCTGIFWDEFVYSATEFHYGEPWDGVSGDIDARTHKVRRLKSSIALLSLPWRQRMLEHLGENKVMLIANGGGPYTRTLSDTFKKYNFCAFVETGSVSNLSQVHLFTPIGLGDHITETTELDCYRNMLRHLDFGCLYYYYHQQVEPFTHYTLSRYMFPTTPVELRPGYILAKERILTRKPGYYSFGGNEEAEAHFFDANGNEVKREAPKSVKDGKTFYKVELGEFESCALVRVK